MPRTWRVCGGGTLFVASVKTPCNKIYPVAIGLMDANESCDTWTWMLQSLKEACPMLDQSIWKQKWHTICSCSCQIGIRDWWTPFHHFFQTTIANPMRYIYNGWLDVAEYNGKDLPTLWSSVTDLEHQLVPEAQKTIDRSYNWVSGYKLCQAISFAK